MSISNIPMHFGLHHKIAHQMLVETSDIFDNSVMCGTLSSYIQVLWGAPDKTIYIIKQKHV